MDGIEQDQRLGAPAAVLGAAEGEQVDAAFPGHFGRCRIKRHQRIGEAGAVHMQGQPGRLGDGGDRIDFVEAVDGAGLGRLRHGDRHRLAAMDAAATGALDFLFQPARVHLARRPIDRGKLGAMREEFRRAAFIRIHMRFAVAEHVTARTIGTGQRQRVGSGSGGDEEHGDVTFEHLRQRLLDLLVEVARAIGRRKAAGGLDEAFGNHGMGARPVVG